MILLQVRDYIKKHNQVSLQDLACYFQRDPNIMRDMVGHWLRKGIIQKAPKPSGCGVKCVSCKPSTTEIYCWRPPLAKGPTDEIRRGDF